MSNPLKAIWRRIIIDKSLSWVLFNNGTCVVLIEPEQSLEQQAIAIMQEWGQVYPGSPSGDFSVVPLEVAPGWVVTSHYDDMFTYVSPEELDLENPQEIDVGLFGRNKRQRDAEDLDIVHVEDKRTKFKE